MIFCTDLSSAERDEPKKKKRGAILFVCLILGGGRKLILPSSRASGVRTCHRGRGKDAFEEGQARCISPASVFPIWVIICARPDSAKTSSIKTHVATKTVICAFALKVPFLLGFAPPPLQKTVVVD